jgi:predicted dehydrogenase
MAERAARFAAVGLNHNHIYGQAQALLDAGAELVAYFAEEPELGAEFGARFPQARQARSADEILEDPTIGVIATAAIPSERAPLAVRTMRHGKDVLADKPGATDLDQLAELERVRRESGRIWAVYFSEHFANRATVRAGELVGAGAIGRVVQTTGFGPHRLNLPTRPDWFFRRARYGGILADIASHQVEQFLFFTGSRSARVVAAQVGNFAHPEYPELEDYGDLTLRGDGGLGSIRVDWYTPDGLPTWGDGRLFILGTEGYVELRKYCDPAGRPGGDHLLLVDRRGVHYEDCGEVELPFGRQFLADVRDRTETAVSQARTILATRLALEAQARAERVDPDPEGTDPRS